MADGRHGGGVDAGPGINTGINAGINTGAVALWRCWTTCNQRTEITGALESVCLLDASRGTLCEALKAYREALEIRKRLTVPEPADTSP